MCGIGGIFIRDPEIVKNGSDGLNDFVDIIFDKLESRGRHATGMVGVAPSSDPKEKPKVQFEKSAIPATRFIKGRDKLVPGTNMVLCHTRWFTKGTPSDNVNNHPVVHKTCFGIHNGMIKNDDKLFEDRKYKRSGEVDSEIIPAILAHTDWTKPEELKAAMEALQGDFAIAVIDPIRYPDTLLLAKGKGSPLYWLESKQFVMWASTYDALKEAWSECVGTPPAMKRFGPAEEGDLFVFGLGTTDKYKFEPKDGYDFGSAWAIRRPTPKAVPKTTGITTGMVRVPQTGSPGTRQGDSEKKDSDAGTPSTAVVVVKSGKSPDKKPPKVNFPSLAEEVNQRVFAADVREKVSKIRAEGVGIARFWEPGTAKSEGTKHSFCFICQYLVNDEDFTTHNTQNMCVDCAMVRHGMGQQIARGEEFKTDPEKKEVPKDDKTLLSTEQRELLYEWAENDDFIHHEVILELEATTGLHGELIEAIVFRIERDQDYDDSFDEIQELLCDEYDRVYLHQWAEWEDLDKDHTNTTTPQQTMLGWRAAFDKATVTEIEDEAAGDDPLDAEFTEIHGSVKPRQLELVPAHAARCRCGVIVHQPRDSRGLCRSCTAEEEVDAAHASFLHGSERPDKCLRCRKKARIWLHGHDKAVGYCSYHALRCQTDGCDNTPNHTGPDGRRYCHVHSRSVGGLKTHSVLSSMGYTFSEDREVKTA